MFVKDLINKCDLPWHYGYVVDTQFNLYCLDWLVFLVSSFNFMLWSMLSYSFDIKTATKFSNSFSHQTFCSTSTLPVADKNATKALILLKMGCTYCCVMLHLSRCSIGDQIWRHLLSVECRYMLLHSRVKSKLYQGQRSSWQSVIVFVYPIRKISFWCQDNIYLPPNYG